MTTLKEIENAVAGLPESKLDEFRKWFEEFDGKAWDEQFERDVKKGKLDIMADEALADLDSGKTASL